MAIKDLEQRIILPVCKAEWLHIVTPDTKFDDLGKFKLNLLMDPELFHKTFEPLKPILDEAVKIYQEEENEKAKKAGKKPKPLKISDSQPWIPGDEMEDGTLVVKLGRKAAFINDTNEVVNIRLPVLDGRGVRIPDNVLKGEKFGNGTEVRPVVTVRPYNMATQGVGLSLRLEKVQIIKKVSYESGPDSELGAYEGAEYEQPEMPAPAQDPEMGQSGSDSTDYQV